MNWSPTDDLHFGVYYYSVVQNLLFYKSNKNQKRNLESKKVSEVMSENKCLRLTLLGILSGTCPLFSQMAWINFNGFLRGLSGIFSQIDNFKSF